MKLVLTYGRETWMLTERYIKQISVLGRRIIRKICGMFKENKEWRHTKNKKFYQCHRTSKIITDIKIAKLL